MCKPRIAFFIDQWRPGSGTENQLQGLLSHLSPNYVDAHLFTLREPLEPEYRAMFPCPVECLGIGRLLSPAAILKLPGIVARLRRGRRRQHDLPVPALCPRRARGSLLDGDDRG